MHNSFYHLYCLIILLFVYSIVSHLSINDNESCAELLLERFVDNLINQCDENGRSSVHAAAFNNHVECLQLLLRYNASASSKDQTGKTPLMVAASYGHSATVGEYKVL